MKIYRVYKAIWGERDDPNAVDLIACTSDWQTAKRAFRTKLQVFGDGDCEDCAAMANNAIAELYALPVPQNFEIVIDGDDYFIEISDGH